jgi:hypothetical protein
VGDFIGIRSIELGELFSGDRWGRVRLEAKLVEQVVGKFSSLIEISRACAPVDVARALRNFYSAEPKLFWSSFELVENDFIVPKFLLIDDLVFAHIRKSHRMVV